MAGVLSYGPRGSIESLPVGYTSGVIIKAGIGIRHTMRAWGLALMKNGGKDPDLWKEDFSLRFLGYTTDNGAYYYYNTEPGMNYEETILSILDLGSIETVRFCDLYALRPPPSHVTRHAHVSARRCAIFANVMVTYFAYFLFFFFFLFFFLFFFFFFFSRSQGVHGGGEDPGAVDLVRLVVLCEAQRHGWACVQPVQGRAELDRRRPIDLPVRAPCYVQGHRLASGRTRPGLGPWQRLRKGL